MTYLGLSFDNKLSWTPHLKILRQRIGNLTNSMKHTAGMKWGIPANLLKSWYKTISEHIILYGASIWGQNVTSTMMKPLLSIQRSQLLVISRAYRTSPTSALQAFTGLPPLDLVVERETAVIKATRLNKNTSLWGQSIIHTDYEKYKSRYLCHPAQFDLMDTIHINSDSPAQNDHALYTDVSKTKAGTGCGFCELDKGSIIFSWKRRLNESNSVFQAELIALHATIIHSRRNGLNQVHIYTDSASSLQALSSMHSRSPLVNKIQRTLLSIPIPFRPVLCWVPAHWEY
ncbi:uncharacterized protein LOC118189218 [Stegodyphus dumicola]|uniref:uncharacterized protein LOC118189218 n=1 Tax=Stegodyphus dumicola TaxID=202533 RepID=UPI0015AC86C4|nr:uncharacterized protein LOC118189218 [Stegodyphus dumicola]